VRHRPGRLDSLQTTVDGEDLDDADHDRKTTRPVTFLQDDNLLIGRFVDDNPRQLNFHIHGNPL